MPCDNKWWASWYKCEVVETPKIIHLAEMMIFLDFLLALQPFLLYSDIVIKLIGQTNLDRNM